MKILFVIPKSKTMFGDDSGTKSLPGHPHVGIASLVAFLKKNYPANEIKIFDEQAYDFSELKKIIRAFKPDLIGITCFSYNYRYFYDLILKIKKLSKTLIVLGGPHVSALRKEVLKETKADLAIKGEGEITLCELIKELEKTRPNFRKIKGLIWRQKGKVIENEDRELIKNLDNLPFPDYYAFPIERYPCFLIKALPLITSRGCPYGCNYCSVRLSMGRGFRPRSPENVLQEIKYWYQKGWTNFDINDDCFTLDLKRAEKICDLIVKKNLKIKFQLYNGIRVDRISLKLLKKLKKAGCTFIAYGCESGNEKILKIIGKGISLKQVRQAVDWTNYAGIKNAVNFIIGHPTETYTQALETLSFAKSLPTNFVNFYNLVPYPGTGSFQWAKKHGHFLYPPETFLRDISYRDNLPIFETSDFTEEQRQDIMRKGFSLYEKKILSFRLGSIMGSIIYLLTRPKIVNKLVFDFALANKFGNRLYQFLSAKSRN